MGIGVGGYGHTGTQVHMGVLYVSPPLQTTSPGGVSRIQQFTNGGDITIGVRWEHIPVARPLADRDRSVGRAYSYGYTSIVVQRKLGKLEHWWRVLDDIDTIIWRPYMDSEVWAKDELEMPYVYMSRYLIGRMPFIIERFLHNRVQRQYGRHQGMPQGACLYARRRQVVLEWGPIVDSVAAIEEYMTLAGQI